MGASAPKAVWPDPARSPWRHFRAFPGRSPPRQTDFITPGRRVHLQSLLRRWPGYQRPV